MKIIYSLFPILWCIYAEVHLDFLPAQSRKGCLRMQNKLIVGSCTCTDSPTSNQEE